MKSVQEAVGDLYRDDSKLELNKNDIRTIEKGIAEGKHRYGKRIEENKPKVAQSDEFWEKRRQESQKPKTDAPEKIGNAENTQKIGGGPNRLPNNLKSFNNPGIFKPPSDEDNKKAGEMSARQELLSKLHPGNSA